jgi:hypothetical protein
MSFHIAALTLLLPSAVLLLLQALVPHVLGTLIDHQQRAWAVELGKQLMYDEGERSIDYTALGWAMAQVS